MDAGWQKFLAQTGQRRRFCSAEHVRRNREIELIDEAVFQQRAKQRWPPFACKPADTVLIT